MGRIKKDKEKRGKRWKCKGAQGGKECCKKRVICSSSTKGRKGEMEWNYGGEKSVWGAILLNGWWWSLRRIPQYVSE